MDIKRRVALRIRTIRKARGLTQEDLAGMIDRSVDTISAIERGVNLPTYETLEKLAEGLGLPLAQLFEQDAEDTPRRLRAMARLQDAARALPDDQLEKLAGMAEVLAGR
jgi:transcriptional regulator with XRE-family HTH domain